MGNVFAGGSGLGSFAAGAEPGVVCSFDEHDADTAATTDTAATGSSSSSSTTSSSSASKRAAGLVLHGEQLDAADLVSDPPNMLCYHSLELALLLVHITCCTFASNAIVVLRQLHVYSENVLHQSNSVQV
jgi:hypothetical protein